MIVMMAVSLFTFRELLKELGVDDYGTYNVVGGVVILFSFLSNAMTQSNQRYISYHIGQKNLELLRKVFSMILNVQVVVSIVIVLLAETVGLWFINTKMNFEGEKMVAVNWLYQFSILTFVIQILQIPYTSAIISFERMSFFSYFSIAEALLRLGVVFSLSLFINNRLIIYGALLCLSALLILIVYVLYCNRAFESCKYYFNWNRQLFFELIGFSGWNMLGGIGNVGAGQGINILFNIFYGVALNASMGISQQVSSAVSSLVNNVQVAFNPQIVKSYAANDLTYFNSLIFRAARISFCLISIVGIPIIIYMNTILSLWLTIVPSYAVEFTQLTIIFCMIDTLSGPLWTANQASGKVRNYMIIISILILSNLPIAYAILKLGISPVYVLITRIIINGVVLLFRLIYLWKTICFPAKEYAKKVLGRVIIFSLFILPLILIIKHLTTSSLIAQLIYFLSTILIISIIGIRIMLIQSERKFIFDKAVRLLHL